MPDTPMATTAATMRDAEPRNEARNSAVAWGAIFGGAFAAAAVTLILLALGSGFGLASVSPWPNSGTTLKAFTIAAGIWLIVTQWLSSGIGGYVTGRLRTKWVGMHTHEVFFRDTANGFITWAVATVVGAALLASATTSAISGTARTAANAVTGVAAGAAQGAAQSSGGQGVQAYFVDSLFRGLQSNPAPGDAEQRAEATRILLNGLSSGGMPDADKNYLAQMVAARTGMPEADARKRVDDVLAAENAAEQKVRAAADETRKAGTYLSIFTGLSMLIGAFIACAGAALGGAHRDEY
jgi:signal transduction histidine kinase